MTTWETYISAVKNRWPEAVTLFNLLASLSQDDIDPTLCHQGQETEVEQGDARSSGT